MKIKGLFLFVLFFALSENGFCAEKNSFPKTEFIVYTRLTNGYWQIWLYNLTAKKNTQITHDKSDKKSPWYCADKNTVLYRVTDGQLFVFDIKTNKTEQLCGNIKYIGDAKRIEDKLLFTRHRVDVKDDSDIWLIDLNTNKIKTLVQQAGLQYHPYISKDKQLLFYVSGSGPHNHHIYKKYLHSGKTTQLTFGYGYQILPVLSPDGKNIIYVSDVTGDYEIWRMDAHGRHKQQLTKHKGMDNFPCWSPDGEKIIYTSYENGKFCLMIMDKDGRSKQLLFECGNDCSEPKWAEISNAQELKL